MKTLLLILILLPYLLGAQSVKPGDNCNNAIRLNNKSSFSFDTLNGFTSSGLKPACFTVPVKKDIWVKFNVGQSGTLEFTGIPHGLSEFDWAVYDVTSGCPSSTTAPLGCNYNYSQPLFMDSTAGPHPFGIKGGATTSCPRSGNGNAASEFCPPFYLESGKSYAIMIDNYSSFNIGFDLLLGGSFQIESSAGEAERSEFSNSLNVYPNPFSGRVNISYVLSEASNVKMEVTDILGNKVKSIANKMFFAGTYKTLWDAESLPAGIYLLKISINNQSYVKKLILSK